MGGYLGKCAGGSPQPLRGSSPQGGEPIAPRRSNGSHFSEEANNLGAENWPNRQLPSATAWQLPSGRGANLIWAVLSLAALAASLRKGADTFLRQLFLEEAGARG